MTTTRMGAWLLFLAAAAGAQETPTNGELERRLQEVEADLKALKQKIELQPDAGAHEGARIHFHGYGEMHYNGPKQGVYTHKHSKHELDFHRFVLGWVVDFDDRLRLDAEVDFEHAAQEMELEYAYVEYDLARELSLRAGSLLMPVGPLNEFHEPTNFYSVERPNIYKSVIPTTWQENGGGISLRTFEGRLRARGYTVGGLDGSKFTAADGIRSGRSKGNAGPASELAYVGRIELEPLLGFSLGASGYHGGVAQENDLQLGDADVGILAGDARWQFHGLDLSVVGTRVNVSGADDLARGIDVMKKNTAGTTVLGSRIEGWYAEVGYHVFDGLKLDTDHDLVLFVRREILDTHADMPRGFAASGAQERQFWNYGAAYYPHEQVVVKVGMEHENDRTQPRERDIDRLQVGVGYRF